MAMADGVEIHGNSVRVQFRYEGERCRERVGPNTPEIVDKAKKLAGLIRYEIDNGIFEYARHFPDSPRVEKNTFGHWLNLYLSIKKNQLALSSYRAEEQKSNKHIAPRWNTVQINTIDHIDVVDWVQNTLTKTLGNKTIRDIVSIVRQVFDLYNTRSKRDYNPCTGISIKLPDKPDPDPFDLCEIKKISITPTNRQQELNMMKFMIWDGPRLSEVMALAWEDVENINKGIISYKRAKVLGKYKVTKTRRSTRRHKLLKESREILQEQYKLTGQLSPVEIEVVDRDNRTIRKQKIRPVFLNSRSLKPHAGDQDVRERFWETHLKHANVRYRPPSQCRHTFISQMLSLGTVPLHWISQHVGHTTIEQIQRTYGRWIRKDGADVHGMIEKMLDM